MPADDKIVKMPDRLERRAQRIEAAMVRRAKGDEEWIEGTIELAVELAGARNDFGANDTRFGEWLKSEFGDNRIPKDERGILICWGQAPKDFRLVLEKAETRSLRMIQKAFRTNAKALPTTPHREDAKASIRDHKARTGVYPTVREAAKESGHSRIVIEPALAAVKAEDSAAPTGISYTKAQDRHVEARLKAALKAQTASFNETVRLQVLEENKDYREVLHQLQKEASEKWERYDSLINSHKPIFNDTEFVTILTCLHPDNSASKEKRDSAFKAFNAMKLQLTGKK